MRNVSSKAGAAGLAQPSSQVPVTQEFPVAPRVPVDMAKIAPKREDRLFLVLSIFIGVLSGLLVVSFRVAIEWIKILTLGSAPHAGQARLFFVPMGVGLVVAALVWPAYSTSASSDDGVTLGHATLVQVNGARALVLVAIPLVVSAAVLGAHRAQRGAHGLDPGVEHGDPVAVGDEIDVHRLEREGVEEMLDRGRHRIDVARGSGHGLRQHVALAVEDSG